MKKLKMSLPCRGTVMVLVTIALVALLGMVALAVDLGMLSIGAQRAQQIADTGALTGVASAIHVPTAADPTSAALDRILANVSVNNASLKMQAQCGEADIVFYGSGDAIPGFRTLGPFEEAAQVTAQVTIPYNFGRIFGLDTATLTRTAIAARVYAAGASIVPLWVSYPTFLNPDTHLPLPASEIIGREQPLTYKNDAPELIPEDPTWIPSGNFGLISPETGNSDYDNLLSGLNLTPEMITGNYATIGDPLDAKTGVAWGPTSKTLVDRIDRANIGWSGENWNTPPSFYNPRLIIIPMVSYLDDGSDSGANATYEIRAFGAFWLESVITTGGVKKITGRFIDYTMPGMDDGGVFSGLYVTKLIR